VPIEVPPLRERREDVAELITHFIEQLGGRAGVAPKPFSADAVRGLQSRSWPGNVRELRNAVERLLILSPGRTVTSADVERLLPQSIVISEGNEGSGGGRGSERGPAPGTFESFKQDAERAFILQKLKEFDWNISLTARALAMPRSNLYKKIEKYQLNRESK